jgi:ABC-type antimicrobial peptide transport system permease subunit
MKNKNLKFSGFLQQVVQTMMFVLLLVVYLISRGLTNMFNWKHFPQNLRRKLQVPVTDFFHKITKQLDLNHSGSISRVDLIELSIRNMMAKKTRTMVTVGGMTIGIGAVVFLVSIGYGLQQLVITRVARLEEMKQTDVSPQTGGKIKINDQTLSNLKDISSVDMALPLIAVVGRVNYQNSVSDMAVYGVTTDYLQQSAVKPVEGKIFDSNELVTILPQNSGQVAGASTENVILGDTIQDINFTIKPSTWLRVRESASSSAKILGYTKRVEGNSSGEEIWGGTYASDDNAGKAGTTAEGKTLGKWIKASVLLWKEEKCDTQNQGDCEDGKYMVLRDTDNQQVQEDGYVAELNVTLSGSSVTPSKVLGVSTDTSSANAGVSWVEIASESGTVAQQQTKTVALTSEAKKQAVVNRAMLKVLGINENEAIGKTFSVSFVVVGDLLANATEKVESAPTDYTIVGVTPEESTPIFYVPFIDLRTLGVANYSQVKVVAKNQTDLAKIRKQIEAMGYTTRSVADTVAQINSLFATAKTLLLLLGMVALAVAALGMFNTLTVSLLERTREVGLMKAMGMKSSEVKELFLTESMTMGFFGGVLGIVAGFVLGKLLGLILSFFAIFKGVGYIDVSYLPLSFVLVILLLSLIVGLATGIYPAKRATKISALNALRYE